MLSLFQNLTISRVVLAMLSGSLLFSAATSEAEEVTSTVSKGNEHSAKHFALRHWATGKECQK